MNRLHASIAAFLFLNACSDGTKTANSTIYPTGIATDAAALHETKGIYTGDTLCCWLNAEAQFIVPVASDSKEIVLQTYEPTSGPLSQSQSITIVTPGSKGNVSRPVHAGSATVVLPILPGMVANGMAKIHIVVAKSVVPKDAGLNGDLRRLSVVLESASAR